MRINRSDNSGVGLLNSNTLDILMKVFQISLVPTILGTGYLFYLLLSGQLGAVYQSSTHEQRLHAIQVVSTLSSYLNISLLVTILTAIIIFNDADVAGVALVAVAAFLAFGLEYVMNIVFGNDIENVLKGQAALMAMHEVNTMAQIIGVPGAALCLWQLFMRIRDSRNSKDLTRSSTYGKDTARVQRKEPLIGAFAKCWELPFCREGIRVRCPIFHAKTKCWQQKVGCMCEENIILLAMAQDGSAPQKTVPMAAMGSGFVPLGDLLTQPAPNTPKVNVPTRKGPRGVRIPENPNLTGAQKRERCRNCIIYNEHQRRKYQLMALPATLAVPVLVGIFFSQLMDVAHTVMGVLDHVMGHLSLDPSKTAQLSKSVSGNVPVEALLIVCLTLVAMTWAQRLLEYCIFKIKI